MITTGLALWPLRKAVYDALTTHDEMRGQNVKVDNKQAAYPYAAIAQIAMSQDDVDAFGGTYMVTVEVWGQKSNGGTLDVNTLMDKVALALGDELALESPFNCAQFQGIMQAMIGDFYDQQNMQELVLGSITFKYFVVED